MGWTLQSLQEAYDNNCRPGKPESNLSGDDIVMVVSRSVYEDKILPYLEEHAGAKD